MFGLINLHLCRLELLWQEEVSRKGPKRASFGSVVWRFVRTRIIVSSIVYSLSLALGFIGLVCKLNIFVIIIVKGWL